MKRSVSFFKYLSLFVCIVLLYFFVKDYDLALVFDKAISFSFLLLLFATFLSHLFASIAWRYSFINFPLDLSSFRLFFIRLCGESFAIINPTNVIGGEAVKAYILKKRGVDYNDALVSIFISRIFVILSLVFLLFIAFFYLFDLLALSFGISLGFLEIGIIILFLLFSLSYILYLSYKSGYFLSLPFVKLSNYFSSVCWLSGLSDRLLLLDKQFFEALAVLRFKLVWVFVFNLLHWLCGAFEIYLILYFLGFSNISFFDSFLMETGITLFKFLGSFVPGQIGFEEYGNKFMLDLLSVGPLSFGETWVAFSLLRRSRQVVWVFLGMFILPFFVGRKELAGLKEGEL